MGDGSSGFATPRVFRYLHWLFGFKEDVNGLFLHATSLYPLSGDIRSVLGVSAMRNLKGDDTRKISQEKASGLGTDVHWKQINPNKNVAASAIQQTIENHAGATNGGIPLKTEDGQNSI